MSADTQALWEAVIEKLLLFDRDGEANIWADCMVLADALEEQGANERAEYWRKVADREWWPMRTEWAIYKWRMHVWDGEKTGLPLPLSVAQANFSQAVVQGEYIAGCMEMTATTH